MKEMVEQDLLSQVEHEQTKVELNGQKQTDNRWKAYEEYKVASIDWLGKIPGTWTTGALKTYCLFISRGNSPEYVEKSSVKVINQACVYNDKLRIENIKYQRERDISSWKGTLQRGDVLINSTGTGTLGRTIVFNLTGIWMADGHVTIMRPKAQHLLPYYLKYLLQTPLYQGYIYAALVSGSTNQIELSREKLRSTPLPIPPLYEQHAISSFLNREITRINDLIVKKEQHIALLQEQRTAIINQAVIKGLDADVPLKDSGIEWLGKIPVHWYCTVIKRCLSSLKDGTHGTFQRVSEGIPLLSAKNVDNGTLQVTDAESLISEVDYKSIQQNGYLKTGDLLLTIVGTIGRTAIFNYPEPVAFQRSVAVLRVRKEYSTAYFCYLIQSVLVQTYLKSRAKQSAQSGVYLLDVSLMPVILPPFLEQQSIVTFIEQETTKIDKLITRIQESIKKLKEYSTALVTAAVTGQIDVRRKVGVGSELSGVGIWGK